MMILLNFSHPSCLPRRLPSSIAQERHHHFQPAGLTQDFTGYDQQLIQMTAQTIGEDIFQHQVETGKPRVRYTRGFPGQRSPASGGR